MFLPIDYPNVPASGARILAESTVAMNDVKRLGLRQLMTGKDEQSAVFRRRWKVCLVH